MLKNMEQADSLKIKYQPPGDRTGLVRHELFVVLNLLHLYLEHW